ncbi:DUF5926 family protein [Trueperella pecoris]|uniref:DUF5926 family protein n=1 Tax=Trueperella pecoris TaxID=2733571 RepID=UPI00186B7D6E|nr:DUF5926 family protein [Trueperella pecoris]QOQ39784.1 topoisomerase II [Trueperella pecoris]QTG75431.1 topoisomerase II [Trueperella pecoris]
MGKSSRRNKEAKPKKARVQFVDRPFEGLPFEAELVAMREIIPSATLPVTTTAEHGSREVTLVTILPGMGAALRRKNGEVLVAVQTVMSSGDVSLDIADRLLKALELEPGQSLLQADLPEPGPRLQDVIDTSKTGELTIHDSYDYWVDEDEAKDPNVQMALQQTSDQMVPTAQVEGVEGAYWCRMQREFLRWVRPEEEEKVLDGLARLHHKRELTFDDARFVGAFRAMGLLIPVFELVEGAEADELAKPLTEFEAKLEAAIASTEPLSAEERRTRSGIISRQVTLR